MKESEVIHLGTPEPWEVLRVPGGWVYTRFCENGTGGYDMAACFVPEPNAELTHPESKP